MTTFNVAETFALNQADKDSGTWVRLKEHLEAELAHQREVNDKPATDLVTAHTRGRIAQLKELIALDAPAPGVDG